MKVRLGLTPDQAPDEGAWQNWGLVEQPDHPLLVLNITTISGLIARLRIWILTGK